MWTSTQRVNYWSYILQTSNTWKKWEYNEAAHQLFIDFKKAYDSFRKEVMYNILIEFGIHMHLESLKKCAWMKGIAESG